CFQAAFHETEFSQPLKTANVRDSSLAQLGVLYAAASTVASIAYQIGNDRAVCGGAVNDRPVNAMDRVMSKLRDKSWFGRFSARKHQQSAGVAIQAMDTADTILQSATTPGSSAL